jgi:proteasome accessory factor A
VETRIFGLENEYGLISSSLGGKLNLSVESALGYLFEKVVSRQRGTNDFLRNGARLYQDTGCHPEYATPECDNALDLVIHDKAGERIVEELLYAAERKLRENGIYCEIFIFKNNTDSVGNTYGCHENYLVERTVNFHKLAELLIPFFVTRQIYTGAGKVLRTRTGNHYYVSQRAQHIYQEISGATTSSRGIINTRDEPHADEEKYRRLHVIVGDSNMSELATYLKVGTTAIVLSLVEDGVIRKDMALEDPVRAIKEISHDITCRRKVRLKRGVELSAIEIQREYLECALEYYQTRETPPQTLDLLEKWGTVLDRLHEDPRSLNRELDWVIKLDLIQSYMQRKKIGFEDQRVSMLDLQYHDIRRDKGIYYALERQGLVERVVTDDEVLAAMEVPPADTRAYFRGMCVRKYGEAVYGASWSSLLFDTGELVVKKLPMTEPTRGTRKLTQEILERSETVAELLENLAA